LDRINKRSFTVAGYSPERFLISVFLASEKFDSDLELDARMHKTDAHPCPPMNNNIEPMLAQNPWVWVDMGMGMGTKCRALVCIIPINNVIIFCYTDSSILSHIHVNTTKLLNITRTHFGRHERDIAEV
jgi:hypothetical protein